MDCLHKVDEELKSTAGPWFFSEHDYPTMIDFIYVSHVELNLRDGEKWNLMAQKVRCTIG